FPDGKRLHVGRVVAALERAGFQPEHVEGLREDYAETLRHWARRLDENLEEAVRLAGDERVRVWRLYLRAARNGFEIGYTSVFQVLCTRPKPQRPTQSSRLRKNSEQKPMTRSRPVTATRWDVDGSVNWTLKTSFTAARFRGVTVGRPRRSSRRVTGPKSSGWAVRITRSAMSERERYWANAPHHGAVRRLQALPRLFGTIC